MLTKRELKDIKGRIADATPGNWVSYIEGRDHLSGANFIMTGVGATRGPDIELNGATQADQDFIAHARQDIEKLMGEIERLRSEKG